MTAWSWQDGSFNVKYQWPEEWAWKFETSPVIQTSGKLVSRSSLMRLEISLTV
jgi:hypothetical protein